MEDRETLRLRYFEKAKDYLHTNRELRIQNISQRYPISWEDAEDILQDAALKIITKGWENYIDRGYKLESYFNKILMNTAINYLRKRKHSPDLLPHEDVCKRADISNSFPDPSKLPSEDFDHLFFELGIDKSDPFLGVSELILASSFQWSYEEISKELQIPVGTVRSRINRAKTSCRQSLETSV